MLIQFKDLKIENDFTPFVYYQAPKYVIKVIAIGLQEPPVIQLAVKLWDPSLRSTYDTVMPILEEAFEHLGVIADDWEIVPPEYRIEKGKDMLLYRVYKPDYDKPCVFSCMIDQVD